MQKAHCHQRLDLLVAPFCGMAARPDHPTFNWPPEAAERFAAAASAAPRLHAAKLRVHTVACHHCGTMVLLPCCLLVHSFLFFLWFFLCVCHCSNGDRQGKLRAF